MMLHTSVFRIDIESRFGKGATHCKPDNAAGTNHILANLAANPAALPLLRISPIIAIATLNTARYCIFITSASETLNHSELSCEYIDLGTFDI